jgi:hypothetical protein
LRTKTQQAFQVLLADLFDAPGCSSSLALPHAGHCSYAGVDVAIYFDAATDPSHVHAYIDFGRVAPARQREVYRKLLSCNLGLAPKHRAIVGVDAGTERVVLVARVCFDDTLNGERLAAILRRLIRKVDAWRLSAEHAPTVRIAASGRTRVRRPPS